MKIASATGFAVVCTTELAFEYLKQTEQIKLIVLITRPLRPYSATRGFARVSTARLLQSRYKMQVSCIRLSMHHRSMLFSNLKWTTALISIYRHARVFWGRLKNVQLASTDLSGFCGLYTGCLYSVPIGITQMHFTINVSNLYIQRQNRFSEDAKKNSWL